MILPDINLLLYATLDGFEQHEVARSWWEGCLNGDDAVALCAPVIFGFVRIGTNPRIFDPAMSVEMATGYIDEWLARPQVQFLSPGPRHLEIAFRLLRALGTAANLTTATQLAALAVEHQAELCSCDSDFSRFPGLRWTDPLAR